jgi:hypothetical protein
MMQAKKELSQAVDGGTPHNNVIPQPNDTTLNDHPYPGVDLTTKTYDISKARLFTPLFFKCINLEKAGAGANELS